MSVTTKLLSKCRIIFSCLIILQTLAKSQKKLPSGFMYVIFLLRPGHDSLDGVG